MSEDFTPLADGFYVSPQITAEDVAAAKAAGVTLIINNRPDDEEPGQPSGASIKAAAEAAGIAYVAIPVGPAGVSPADLDAFDAAVGATEGAVLGYCRSGTRSTIVRALARARAGEDVDALIREAAEAGYNIAGQRPMLEAAAR